MVRSSFADLIRLVAIFSALLIPAAAPAIALETSAPRALIVEIDSGTLLFAKELDQPFAPGNFAKLMTAAVVFGALEGGEIAVTTTYKVSEHAWRTGGAPARVTTMFAAVRSEIPVADLLKGLVVHYANDAALVLAEGLSGSEPIFVQRMNELAGEIGMTRSRFANATGYKSADARVTVRDLRTLIDHIRTRHPRLYALYAMPDFEWNRIFQRNKTKYVHELAGVEGLMLAYDETDGFAAAVSAVRGGRRMLLIASGFTREGDRDSAVKSLLEAAYRDFTRVTLFEPGVEVGTVRVFGGATTRVPVVGESGIRVTLPVGGRDEFRLAIVYDGPVPAPIERGQRVAALEVRNGPTVFQTVPLVAAEDVPVGSLTERARDGVSELLFGWW